MAGENMDIADVLEEPVPISKEVDLLSGDLFFSINPGKVLGEAYEASGRFGPVTKYRGGLAVLERIEVPMDFVGARKTAVEPLLSVSADEAAAVRLEEPDMARFVERVTRQSKEAVADGKRRREARTRTGEGAIQGPQAELVTFEQIYRRHNPAISQAELEVFVWYKSAIGKPLSRQWINLIEERFVHDLRAPETYTVSETKVQEWIREGLLFYFNGQYLPAFLYLSGDIYARKFQLERDSEQIIEKHGQDVYEKQQERLSAVFRDKYDKRLVIGTGDNSLSLLATSKFAANFFVEELESSSGDGFKIRKVKAASSKQFGAPDFFKDAETSEYKKDKFDRLNLQDAFAYWLIRSSPEIKEAVTAQEIIKYYLQGSPVRSQPAEDSTPEQKKEEQSKVAKFKASLQKEGERLFAVFVDSELTANDKVRLETQWNATYNNYVPVDYNKVPVAFSMAKYYKGRIEQLRPEKREAVAFVLSAGTGCLAFDVGVGKTPSSIFTISAFLEAGYTRRPFVCVPNQVYKQFIQEIREFAPHIPVLEAYNLGEGYIENFQGPDGTVAAVPEGCITVMTYEGLERIGFTEQTSAELLGELYTILNQGGESDRPMSQRQKESFHERLETLIGRGLRGTLYNIEDFGFDFGCYDEAHKLKKIFTAVKGEVTVDDKGKGTRQKNPYAINSGTPSSIGLKAFMLNQYILKRNNYQNVLLLTATPFTNSPLEIFSMLAMLAYEQLQDTDLNNIKNFFDTYIQTSTELVINPKLKPEFKQVILGFKNLVSLQTLIRRFINYKTGEDVNVQRPDKYILPYTHKLVGGNVLALSPEERVETTLPMTAQQKAMMDEIVAYVEGKISDLAVPAIVRANEDLTADQDEEGQDLSEGEEVAENVLSETEKRGVRTLRGMSFARNLALSPYLYEFSGLGEPDFHSYVHTSPKLMYVMGCIRSVKRYHEGRSEPVSGQVIYMDRGIEYFGLLRQYLIEEIGYKPHEVGIIRSGMPAGSKKGSKEHIKNLFNGEQYNPTSGFFEPVDDSERIKVIIGSATIKEGINLQRYSTVLYDCWLDWNPTDFQQLSGRIWRQGNLFNSVRIALPLVVDSMDIFIFQKLQEKTSRLNTIWATDGRTSVLKLEEFDPAELKYALVRDPRTVAELKVIDEQAVLDGEILGIKRLADRITRIKEAAAVLSAHFDEARTIALRYRNVQLGDDQIRDAQKIALAIQDVLRRQTDKQGRPMVNASERKFESEKRGKPVQYSDENPVYKQYWFDDFNLAQRMLNREVGEFLQPRGIVLRLDNMSNLDRYQADQENEMTAIEERITALKDPANLEAITREVIREREQNKVTYKPVSGVVADFERLNYLLEDRKVATVQVRPVFDSCPPMEDGKRLITEEAIGYLERCVASLAQTRDMHIHPDGTYTAERVALHKKIERELFQAVRCVSKGKPIAVFTGGSPGAGKTHFLREHAEFLLSPDVFHLDADEIREKLPEYQGWNASQTHRESQDMVSQVLDKIGDGACRYDFIYDGTMNKAQKYFSLIRRVKALGYLTFIVFIEVPPAVARQRVLERYRKTGRYVPMAVLDEFHQELPSGKTRGQVTMDELKEAVDGYVVVDGVTGKIISRGGKSLPKDRSYGDFWQSMPGETPLPEAGHQDPAEETIPPKGETARADKETIRGYIESLSIALKYLEGADKKQARERIATYKLSLKYL